MRTILIIEVNFGDDVLHAYSDFTISRLPSTLASLLSACQIENSIVYTAPALSRDRQRLLIKCLLLTTSGDMGRWQRLPILAVFRQSVAERCTYWRRGKHLVTKPR